MTHEELALYAIARAEGLNSVDAVMVVQGCLRADLAADRDGWDLPTVAFDFELACQRYARTL